MCTFIKCMDSLIKRVIASWDKTTNVIKYAVNDNSSNLRYEDAHMKRVIENTLIFLNAWHHPTFIDF